MAANEKSTLPMDEQLRLLLEKHVDPKLLEQFEADKELLIDAVEEVELHYTALGACDANAC